MKITRKLLGGIVAVVASMAMTSVGAFAVGHGSGGGGTGGVGGGGTAEPPTTELTNNLSVPTVFIGENTGPFTLQNTDGTLVEPSGETYTGYEAPGYYYVQGVNTWQSEYVI